ncbi:MAG: SUMF1/EgtB/PvdO family nonheme iron enzyme [Muribaculaceae bacterium]|nr:SUMF1/EgtB/PvdO family nonheme iron enzyme [Muribaculaceae bacterium]
MRQITLSRVLLMVAISLFVVFPARAVVPTFGDVDGDGKSDVIDVTALINYILTGNKPTVQTEVITVKGVKFKMVKVIGGSFIMGTELGTTFDVPLHKVTLSDYYIGQTEVTQALWKAVMGTNPSEFKGDNLPVEKVSRDDCITFITKLNSLTGKNFRLPTEAEWEFAARGGNRSLGYTFAGSYFCDKVAWFKDNSDGKTHNVGTKLPNELGLYDMTGNVWEWCSDWWDKYSSDDQTNQTGFDPNSTVANPLRVIRGGGWSAKKESCSMSLHNATEYSVTSTALGFRLAR